jgi:hypothetical protein
MPEDFIKFVKHISRPSSICPFVAAPFPECYCIDTNSLKISLAVRYCMGRYVECDLFQLLITEGHCQAKA